jgi:hypothetical protein
MSADLGPGLVDIKVPSFYVDGETSSIGFRFVMQLKLIGIHIAAKNVAKALSLCVRRHKML